MTEENIIDFEPEPEPDSPRTGDREPISDDDDAEDPSAEIIQIEDLDDSTISQHR